LGRYSNRYEFPKFESILENGKELKIEPIANGLKPALWPSPRGEHGLGNNGPSMAYCSMQPSPTTAHEVLDWPIGRAAMTRPAHALAWSQRMGMRTRPRLGAVIGGGPVTLR
jgi:hypothetical protein